MAMRSLLAALSFGLAVLVASPAGAAELLMFEQAGCPFCQAFDRDIAPIYAKSDEGRIAPLRRVDIFKPIPADLAFVQVERITPVFVLVDQGHEIGRIRGYASEEQFWGLLSVLVRKLGTSAPAPAPDLLRTEKPALTPASFTQILD
jgi:hypothetical protein